VKVKDLAVKPRALPEAHDEEWFGGESEATTEHRQGSLRRLDDAERRRQARDAAS